MSRDKMKEKKEKMKKTDGKEGVAGQKESDSGFRLKLLAATFLLLLIVLSSVIILRLSNEKPALTSGESYYHLRMGLLIKDDPLAREDPIQGRYYSPSPFHFFLAGCLMILPPNILANFLPAFLGLAVALLFFRLLLLLGIPDRKAIYSAAILAFSPAFIILFTGLYTLGFSLLLSLCALILFLKEKKSRAGWLELLASFFCLAVLALTSLPCMVITILLILILSLFLKKSLWFFFITSILLLFIVFLLSSSEYLWPGFFSLGFHPLELKGVFSVFGATLGFDIFLLLIFLMGFMFSWSEKEKRPYHLAILGLVILSFFNTPFRVFASLAITPYCVEAMFGLHRRRWELRIIKVGTTILLLCALVFSLVNQVNIQLNSEPSRYMHEALMSMRSNAAGSVLSDESNGFMIEFFSERKAFIDDNSRFQSNYDSLKRTSMDIFNSSRINEVSPLLDNLRIRYVLLTTEMKEQLWESREEKLLLLVENSGRFDNRYDESGIDVWLYLPG
jgi:hypothetical protein